MPTKSPTPRVKAAFDSFLASDMGRRFRQSDVAAVVLPLISPRDRTVAKDMAATLIRMANAAGRLDRTGHLHWMTRPTGQVRKLVDGREVAEAPGLVKLELGTRCPAKWAAVDLETGEVWEGSASGWRRASDATMAAAHQASRPVRRAA